MKFLSNSGKKYFAAAAVVFAAVAIPAQATDCNTTCQQAAGQAGSAAANQAYAVALAYCNANYTGFGVASCMNEQSPKIGAAYNQAYQQKYNECMGSCQ